MGSRRRPCAQEEYGPRSACRRQRNAGAATRGDGGGGDTTPAKWHAQHRAPANTAPSRLGATTNDGYGIASFWSVFAREGAARRSPALLEGHPAASCTRAD